MERDKGRDIRGGRILTAGGGKYDCVCRESLDKIVAIFRFVYMYVHVHMHNYVHYTPYIYTHNFLRPGPYNEAQVP